MSLPDDTLSKIADIPNIFELLKITQTRRVRCVQCGLTHNVKARKEVLITEPVLCLPLLPRVGDGSIEKQANALLTLDDCLARNARGENDYRCDSCQKNPLPLNQA